MATEHATTTSLSQLLYSHEKLENLARGPLSEPIVSQMRDTVHELVLEIGNAPAEDWDEFYRKLKALLGDYMDVHQYMDVIRADVGRLAGAA
jgi:hypothetical protein